jgi:hypothetical protein
MVVATATPSHGAVRFAGHRRRRRGAAHALAPSLGQRTNLPIGLAPRAVWEYDRGQTTHRPWRGARQERRGEGEGAARCGYSGSYISSTGHRSQPGTVSQPARTRGLLSDVCDDVINPASRDKSDFWLAASLRLRSNTGSQQRSHDSDLRRLTTEIGLSDPLSISVPARYD